jgi:fructose-bisphosphate aldolase, class I
MYVEGEESMYEAVHAMRTRIITSPAFTGEKILGAILFENTSTYNIYCCFVLFWEKRSERQSHHNNTHFATMIIILFLPITVDRQIEGLATGDYLWQTKNIVPFLKCDKGLADEVDGCQLMKDVSRQNRRHVRYQNAQCH